MDASKLTDRYRRLQHDLADAIERDDEKRIRELDKDLQSQFQAILARVPADSEERLTLARFLADFIDWPDGGSDLSRAAKEKLLQLIREAAARR